MSTGKLLLSGYRVDGVSVQGKTHYYTGKQMLFTRSEEV